MDEGLTSLLTDLRRADSWEAAWRRTLSHFGDRGCEWVNYGYSHADETAPFRAHIVSNMPLWFRDYYDSVGASRYDPSVRMAEQAVEPVLSSVDDVDRNRDGDEVWRLFETIKDFGARSAFLLPLSFRIKRGTGLLLAASSRPSAEFARYFREHHHALHLAALLADARLVELKGRERAAEIGLTARERECLLWLAQGLRNDRIADRLGLSNATVEMHLANARRKLEAATREQALVKAVMLGLVEP